MNRLLLVIDHYPEAARHPYYDSRAWLRSAFQTCLLVVSYGLRSRHYVMSSALYAKVGGRICLQKQRRRWFPLSFFTSFCPSSSLSSLYPPLALPPLLPSPPFHPYEHKDTVYIQVSYYSLPLVLCSPPPTPCPFTPTVPPLWAYSNEGAFFLFLYCHNMINAVFAEGNYCQQKGRATHEVITTDRCVHFLLCHYPPPPPTPSRWRVTGK